MSIIQKLWWFFSELEKHRLSSRDCGPGSWFPSPISFHLWSWGEVIDAITSGQCSTGPSSWPILFVACGLWMYYLRYVWRMYILGTSSGAGMRSRLFEHFTKMSPAFYQTYRTGPMAHATNYINASNRHSQVAVSCLQWMPQSQHVLTMLFSISWMTLVAILPLPFMAYAPV